MAKLAEDMARVAGGIAMGHKQRSELAMEIKVATRTRHSDVQSFLKSLKASRNKMGRERMAEASKMMRARHNEVHAWLKGMKVSRNKADHEHQKQARAVRNARRNDVKALMTQFHQEGMARRKHFREDAAAFMKGLTSGVAALLDSFDKLNCKRAAALHERFAGYAADRRDATAIWRGGQPGRHQAAHKPATMSAAPESKPGEPHFAAQPMDANTQSRRDPLANMGHPSPKESHKGGSK
jgi:hypothetical protein